ncbi:glycosyltransferase family 2 protein [Butyrivibrio sp. AE3006]|uniref:glycosyltransferase family 2 protein n=1 Tax=Butyrivibrio sp. AE3006 TaxID=1280673 RepID=UPI0004210083|nr:glycosyltransferase [Butyrivibrio sp. AE3006]
MKETFFSLILPVYNIKDYIRRSVDSILKQDFDDYEMILVDDGSTDGCAEICDELETTDSRISVIHKENGGLSSARNAGVNVATGKYIFFIDPDDWIEQGALSLLHRCLCEFPCDVLKFNYISRPDGEIWKSSIPVGQYDANDISSFIVKEALINTGQVNFSAWSHIYNLEFLNKNEIRFVSEREIASEDYLYNFQVYLTAQSMKVIDNALYDYDFRDGSLSRRYRYEIFEQYEALNSKMVNFAKKKNKYSDLENELYDSYIGKTFYVVIKNECTVNNTHPRSEALRKIKGVLNHNKLRIALANYKCNDCGFKKRLMLFLMKHKMAFAIYLWHIRS